MEITNKKHNSKRVSGTTRSEVPVTPIVFDKNSINGDIPNDIKPKKFQFQSSFNAYNAQSNPVISDSLQDETNNKVSTVIASNNKLYNTSNNFSKGMKVETVKNQENDNINEKKPGQNSVKIKQQLFQTFQKTKQKLKKETIKKQNNLQQLNDANKSQTTQPLAVQLILQQFMPSGGMILGSWHLIENKIFFLMLQLFFVWFSLLLRSFQVQLLKKNTEILSFFGWIPFLLLHCYWILLGSVKCYFLHNQSNKLIVAANTAQLARAGRASRVGTKAGRVVRLVRLLRFVKLYKQVQEKKDKREQEKKRLEQQFALQQEQLQQEAINKEMKMNSIPSSIQNSSPQYDIQENNSTNQKPNLQLKSSNVNSLNYNNYQQQNSIVSNNPFQNQIPLVSSTKIAQYQNNLHLDFCYSLLTLFEMFSDCQNQKRQMIQAFNQTIIKKKKNN